MWRKTRRQRVPSFAAHTLRATHTSQTPPRFIQVRSPGTALREVSPLWQHICAAVL
ncbi:protein of unknown function [Pararobbsia alpina]